MNSTSIVQNASSNSPKLTPIPPNQNRSQRQFPTKWLLMPLMATPFVVAASSYSSILHAYQSPNPIRPEVNETVATTAASSLELELALSENNTLQKKYRVALEQLQGTQELHTELQVAYQDAQDTLRSLKQQNQQLKALAAERTPLLDQTKQLRGTNKQLESQIHNQTQQLTTWANRLDALDSQKQKLAQDNQQLEGAAKELNALKPELEKARQTIVLLSHQLNQKSDQMTTITVNGKQFSVPQELAAALKTEQQQTTVGDNSSSTKQQVSLTQGQ